MDLSLEKKKGTKLRRYQLLLMILLLICVLVGAVFFRYHRIYERVVKEAINLNQKVQFYSIIDEKQNFLKLSYLELLDYVLLCTAVVLFIVSLYMMFLFGKRAAKGKLLAKTQVDYHLFEGQETSASSETQKWLMDKEQFLCKAVHELRAPISGIIGLVDLAQEQLSNKNMLITSDYINKIQYSSRHLLELVNDLLDQTKLSHGKMQVEYDKFSIPTALVKVLSLLQTQITSRNQHLHVADLHLRNNYASGDEIKFQQILINLLSNAYKFTPVGGHIHIRVSEKELNDVRSMYTIEISDTGIGMTQEMLDHLFVPFTPCGKSVAKEKGTGLGLSIVNEIVKLFHGTIEVESTINVGTKFTVNIPYDISLEKEPILEIGYYYKVLFVGKKEEYEYLTNLFKCLYVKIDFVDLEKDNLQRYTFERHTYEYFILDLKRVDFSNQTCIFNFLNQFSVVPKIAIMNQENEDEEMFLLRNKINYHLNQPVLMHNLYNLMHEISKEKNKIVDIFGLLDFLGAKVLLVDDDPIHNEIMSEFLQLKNIRVTSAKTGEEALEIYMNSPDYHFDLILLDMRLPGMSGIKVSEMIRSSKRLDGKEVAIILMSANQISPELILSANVNDSLLKPIHANELYQKLQENILKNS